MFAMKKKADVYGLSTGTGGAARKQNQFDALTERQALPAPAEPNAAVKQLVRYGHVDRSFRQTIWADTVQVVGTRGDGARRPTHGGWT